MTTTTEPTIVLPTEAGSATSTREARSTSASAVDPSRGPTKATLRVRARLAAVQSIIHECRGLVPLHREILDRLHKLGVKSSKGTVMNDLHTLGYNDATSAYILRHK